MSEAEACRLVMILASDTGSQVHAALYSMSHPMSREDYLLASIYGAWSGQKHWLIPTRDEEVVEAEREAFLEDAKARFAAAQERRRLKLAAESLARTEGVDPSADDAQEDRK